MREQLKPPIELPTASKTYEDWDPSHSGQNIRYHKPFPRTRALFQDKASLRELFFSNDHDRAASKGEGLARPEWEAWCQNERPLFANTRAFFNGNLNPQRAQLKQAIDQLHAAILQHPEYQSAVKLFLDQIGVLSIQADYKDFERLIATVKQVTAKVQSEKSKLPDLIAQLRINRYWERAGETFAACFGLAAFLTFTNTCLLLADLKTPIDMDLTRTADLSHYSLTAVGASIGLLMLSIYANKLFSAKTEVLETQLEAIDRFQSEVK